MKLFHHIRLLLESEQQKAEFLEAGLKLPSGRKVPRGELVTFDIAEDDPRWEGLKKKFAALEREHKAFDLTMTKPTFEESAEGSCVRSGLKWLERYSGQTVEELLFLEGKFRIDSLIMAFEQGVSQKATRGGNDSLTDEERIILAVGALEREVNNGGYDQFFSNSSREFASTIVDSLHRIGCEKTAKITQRAIKALGISDLASGAIESVMATEDEQREEKLSRCDDVYYKSREPIAERLFAFIKANKADIRL